MERVFLNSDGLQREYLLFAPAGRAALVVFLHGMGGTAAWADGETGWSRLARQEGFALALPQGLPPNPTLPPKFLTNPPRWNDGSWQMGENSGTDESGRMKEESRQVRTDFILHPFQTPDDVGFLMRVIDDVASRLDVDPARTFVTGFSNGAGMTFRFAAERANRIAAIAPVAGHCWVPDPKPVRPVPTLYVVGTVDPLIPVRGGDVRSPWQHRLVRRPPVAATLERWAVANGCDVIPITGSDVGGVRVDTYPGPVPYLAIQVDGLGHHWPGGKGQLNRRIAGPPADAVRATERIWEFFTRLA